MLQWGQKANINAEINSPDLSGFSGIAKTKIAGNLNVGLEIEALEFGQIVQAKTNIELQNLETEFPEIKVIAGDRITVTGVGSTNATGTRGSNINWYIFLTVEGGLLSSIPIMLFLVFSFVRIAYSRVPGKMWFLVGLTAGAVHFLAISTFFYPFLWILLIMFFLAEYSMGAPDPCRACSATRPASP